MTHPELCSFMRPDDGEVLGIGLTLDEAHQLMRALSYVKWRGDAPPPTHAFVVECHDRVATWLRAHNRRRDLAREDVSEPAP